MKGEYNMQTNNQVIPELLEMTKLTAHKIGLNKEIAAHLNEKQQRRMHQTMRGLLAMNGFRVESGSVERPKQKGLIPLQVLMWRLVF